MKKALILGLMAISSQTFAQKIDMSKVPAAVKDNFSKNFPGVNNVKWENEKGNFEANFKKGDKKMSALFDAKGTWMETETDIAVTKLPAIIHSYVAANYKGEKIKEAAQLKLANGDNNYEAEVNGMDLIFDINGKYIKSVKD